MNKKFQKGLTLVEIMVSIAIMVVLSAVVFTNYRVSQKQLALQMAANKLAQDIRRVESMVGTEWSECSDTDYKYGYGVYFDSNVSYIIFADCNGSRDYNLSDDKVVERILLGNNIEKFSGDSVVFEPPDPLIFNDTSFVLNIVGTSDYKIIDVNKIGAIDID